VDNKALLGPTHLDKTNDSAIRDVPSHVINQSGVVYKEETASDSAIDLNDQLTQDSIGVSNAGGYFTPEGSDSIEVPTDSLENHLDLSTDLTYRPRPIRNLKISEKAL